MFVLGFVAGVLIDVDGVAGSSFFCAPARFKKIRIPLSAMKTIAQKTNIAREDLWGRCGNSITRKNNANWGAATAEICPS